MISPIEYNQSGNQTNINWFDRLLNFQQLFGLTYQGSCQYRSKRIHIIKKVSLIIYEISVSALVLTILYNIGDGEADSKLYNSTSKKGVLTLLFRLGSSAFMVEYIVHKITIFVNGPQVISIVHSLHFFKKSTDHIIKIKVYLYLICYLSFSVTAISFSFNDLNSIIQNINDENFKFLYYIIGAIFTAITNTSVVVILMFTSELVSRELNELVVHVNNYGKFGTTCNSLFILREKIEKINSLLSYTIIIKIMINGILISTGLCVLADYFSRSYQNGYQIMAILSYISCESVDIILVCNSSQNIINSMESLAQVTEQRLMDQNLSPEEHKLAKVVISLRKRIRFSASTLFDLKSVTVLLTFGYVANYAVILIQTRDY